MPIGEHLRWWYNWNKRSYMKIYDGEIIVSNAYKYTIYGGDKLKGP